MALRTASLTRELDRQNAAEAAAQFLVAEGPAQRMGDPPDDPPSGGSSRPAPPPAGRPPGKFLRATTGVRNCIGREKGLLLFVLTFGALQAAFHRVLAPEPQKEQRSKTVVILDGSKMVSDTVNGDDVLRNPAAVMTFDADGNRVENEWEKAKTAEKKAAAEEAEQEEAKARKERRREEGGRRGRRRRPPPPPRTAAATARPRPTAAARRCRRGAAGRRVAAARDAAGRAFLSTGGGGELLGALNRNPRPPPAPPAAEAAAAAAAAAAAEATEAAEAAAEAAAAREAEAAERPSYVWAQNVSHVFVTVSVPTSRLSLRAVDVTIGSRALRVRVGPGNGEPPLLLELELLRPVDEASSFWRVSARGPHATLVKAEAKQWSRLLRERGPDNKQSVDWGRWSHPEVTRAADREAKRDELARRSHARQKEARGELMPRAQVIFDEWREAQDREWEKGAAMALSDRGLLEVATIRNVRASARKSRCSATRPGRMRARRRRSAPVAQLKSLRRKGFLDSDRRTSDWAEYRRRRSAEGRSGRGEGGGGEGGGRAGGGGEGGGGRRGRPRAKPKPSRSRSRRSASAADEDGNTMKVRMV